MTFWYPRHHLQTRISIFFASASLAGAFSGLLAYAIGFMSGVGGRLAWSWIFVSHGNPFKSYWVRYNNLRIQILEGLGTVVVGIIGIFGANIILLHLKPSPAHVSSHHRQPHDRQISDPRRTSICHLPTKCAHLKHSFCLIFRGKRTWKRQRWRGGTLGSTTFLGRSH